jgi:RNA polymerase sigma factor (sigma-70 family)
MAEPTAVRRTDLTHSTRPAAGADDHAWRDLFTRLDGILHALAKRYRLGAADVDDVVQTTWLRAIDHVDRLDDPGAIAEWLVTTARREAMDTLQRAVREIVTDDMAALDQADPATPEGIAIEREHRAAVRDAVARLPARQRRVTDLLLMTPSPSYWRVAEQTGMPIGSIGRMRDRALARLRDDRQLANAVTP